MKRQGIDIIVDDAQLFIQNDAYFKCNRSNENR